MASDTFWILGHRRETAATAALVRGARLNPAPPTIYSIEVSRSRFERLSRRYQGDRFVRPHNMSSVRLADFPTEREVVEYCASPGNGLARFGVSEVLRWLRLDIEYLLRFPSLPQGAIDSIRSAAGIESFDAALIDGSEFTGWPELSAVRGARFLVLDDITTFKNSRGHASLMADPAYRLVEADPALRNGYSVFELR